MLPSGVAGRLLRAGAAAAVALAPAGCVFYTRLTPYVPNPTAADISGGLSDGELRVHAITSSRAVTSVIQGAFRGPRFAYSEEVIADNSAQRDPRRDLCALLERSKAELLLVALDELTFARGAPERKCLRHETVPSRKEFPEDPLVSVCVEHEDLDRYEARRARYGELTSVVQLVTPALCEGPPALRGAPPSLSGTPERVREQLEELLPRAAVAPRSAASGPIARSGKATASSSGARSGASRSSRRPGCPWATPSPQASPSRWFVRLERPRRAADRGARPVAAGELFGSPVPGRADRRVPARPAPRGAGALDPRASAPVPQGGAPLSRARP
ncbi:hypothetical protein ACMHYB_02480 [Sorangium sp. So ce1128]